jgi:hypothetical protein
MSAYTLAQAIAATGRSRSTLIRAIRSGKISAVRDEAGTYLVEPSELHRMFPAIMSAGDGMPTDLSNGMPRHADLATMLRAEQDKVIILQDVISDLRRRLDAEAEERRPADRADCRSARDPTSAAADCDSTFMVVVAAPVMRGQQRGDPQCQDEHSYRAAQSVTAAQARRTPRSRLRP